MGNKLVYMKDDEFTKDIIDMHMSGKHQSKWIDDFGTYNRFPEPYHEITINEFIHKFTIHSVSHIENRSIGKPEFERMRHVTIFWFHKFALAMVFPDNWRTKRFEGDDPYGIIYDDPIRYFYIGCVHEYEELGAKEAKDYGIIHWGSCYHVYRCKKCGYVEAQDSSD